MSRELYNVTLQSSFFPAVRDGALAEVSIGQSLSQAALDASDLVALKEITLSGRPGRIWTFRDLAADSRRLARVLLRRHAPGSRIAVWANNVAEWVLLEFAAAYAGMTLVTVNPSFQYRELKYALEQSRSTALYYVPSFRGNPMAEIAQQACGELRSIRHRIDMSDLAALYEGPAHDGPLPQIAGRDPAQIQYTSGTTGFPKGAILHHQGLHENARFGAGRVGVERGDVWLNFMPMFHTTGCSQITLGSLSSRATMVLFPQFEPEAVLSAIESERVNFFLGVPTMVTAILERLAERPRDVSSVKAIISGGATVAPELVRRTQTAFGCSFHISYGQTEASPIMSLGWRDASVEEITQTIGQPMPHNDFSIRDPTTNAVVPVGRVGEICGRGYNIMLGYNDDLKATEKAVDAEGWLHSGDLGSMDERGFVRITGRLKDMIIRGGENLFPVEIENAMLEHPALAEVAVVGIPDERWGEVVACFMRPKSHVRPGREELIAFCRSLLSPQKTPTHWIYVDAWPLTGSGKVRKFMLREQFVEGSYNHQRVR